MQQVRHSPTYSGQGRYDPIRGVGLGTMGSGMLQVSTDSLRNMSGWYARSGRVPRFRSPTALAPLRAGRRYAVASWNDCERYSPLTPDQPLSAPALSPYFGALSIAEKAKDRHIKRGLSAVRASEVTLVEGRLDVGREMGGEAGHVGAQDGTMRTRCFWPHGLCPRCPAATADGRLSLVTRCGDCPT